MEVTVCAGGDKAITTIYDIAKAASVSPTTVSRAINRSADVSAVTRERILAIARDLNFRPMASARNMGRGATRERDLTHMIGFVTQREAIIRGDNFFHELLATVESTLCDRGMGIRIIGASSTGEVPAEIRRGEVDGIIGRLPGPLTREIAELVPTVCLDIFDPAVRGYSFVPDYEGGISNVADRLLKSGHRRLAVLSDAVADVNGSGFWCALTRACLNAYAKHSLKAPANLCRGGAATPQQGYAVGAAIFSDRDHLPDAIIGPDGAMLGLYRAAGEHSIRIPADVSIVGVNGLRHTEFLHPPLTTIDCQLGLMGAKAADALTEMIGKGERRRGVEITPTVLIERASARICGVMNDVEWKRP